MPGCAHRWRTNQQITNHRVTNTCATPWRIYLKPKHCFCKIHVLEGICWVFLCRPSRGKQPKCAKKWHQFFRKVIIPTSPRRITNRDPWETAEHFVPGGNLFIAYMTFAPGRFSKQGTSLFGWAKQTQTMQVLSLQATTKLAFFARAMFSPSFFTHIWWIGIQ